jgi:hypothetical protein
VVVVLTEETDQLTQRALAAVHHQSRSLTGNTTERITNQRSLRIHGLST